MSDLFSIVPSSNNIFNSICGIYKKGEYSYSTAKVHIYTPLCTYMCTLVQAYNERKLAETGKKLDPTISTHQAKETKPKPIFAVGYCLYRERHQALICWKSWGTYSSWIFLWYSSFTLWWKRMHEPKLKTPQHRVPVKYNKPEYVVSGHILC